MTPALLVCFICWCPTDIEAVEHYEYGVCESPMQPMRCPVEPRLVWWTDGSGDGWTWACVTKGDTVVGPTYPDYGLPGEVMVDPRCSPEPTCGPGEDLT